MEVDQANPCRKIRAVEHRRVSITNIVFTTKISKILHSIRNNDIGGVDPCYKDNCWGNLYDCI